MTDRVKHPAWWIYDGKHAQSIGHLYYFGIRNRMPPPYLKQIEVTAIVDVASNGTLAGVELIDTLLPPPPPKLKALDYEEWLRATITFIRERGLEAEFVEWCGGCPCPFPTRKSDPGG